MNLYSIFLLLFIFNCAISSELYILYKLSSWISCIKKSIDAQSTIILKILLYTVESGCVHCTGLYDFSFIYAALFAMIFMNSLLLNLKLLTNNKNLPPTSLKSNVKTICRNFQVLPKMQLKSQNVCQIRMKTKIKVKQNENI